MCSYVPWQPDLLFCQCDHSGWKGRPSDNVEYAARRDDYEVHKTWNGSRQSMELVSKGGGLRTISIKKPRDRKSNVSPPVTDRFHDDQAEEYDLE